MRYQLGVQRFGLVFIIVLAFGCFVGTLAVKGVYDCYDIASYMSAGRKFFNEGTLGQYANIGFSLLVVLVGKLTVELSVKYIVFFVSLPCFLLSVALWYNMVLKKNGFHVAILSSVLILVQANHFVRPLSELPFFLLISGVMYLLWIQQKNLFVIGLVAGLTFWMRNQMILFLPFIPLLAWQQNFRQYGRDLLLSLSGFAVFALPFALVYGLSLPFYGGYVDNVTGNIDLMQHFSRFIESLSSQVMRLIGVYFAPINLLIFVGPLVVIPWVWRKEFDRRIYFFALASFGVQLVVMSFLGKNFRPGTYIVHYVIFSYMTAFVAVRLTDWMKRKGAGVVAVVCLIAIGGWALHYAHLYDVMRIIKRPQRFVAILDGFPLNYTEEFSVFPNGSRILVRRGAPYTWTSLNVENCTLLPFPEKGEYSSGKRDLSTARDFSYDLKALNSLSADPQPDGLAIWRRGKQKKVNLPASFVDRFGNHYRLVVEKKAWTQVFGIYTVVEQVEKNL